MEDQPTDSGDLTTGSESGTEPDPRPKTKSERKPKPGQDTTSEIEAHTEAADEASDTETDSGTDTETETDTETDAQAEPVKVAHRPPGRRVKILAAVGAIAVVAAAAFAGATAAPYLVDRAQVQVKLDIAGTAADAISTLWTYTPDDMEALPDRAAKYLGGDFQVEYRKYIDAIAAPNKQAQVSNNTQVLGAAVESMDANNASAIVYTNSVATSPVTKNIPSLRYLSYRLIMEKHGTRWLITQMDAITSLDLTPRL
ncbi:mammalian cell entry protein [Mycolicibacterium neoaurum]|uniref:mammalian cell entry protein n=1 Tax=Mycolicibacterium neoaurum TaxID=1795 RepID=UPI00267152D9|nr:mammalian cell entry protein [Mycolicibacterium neoaurum]MDO3401172.1 mammalian cell entry protein [Mycolicibacterium neoaurum]